MSKFFSLLRREPVRVYLYGVALALVALLVAVGLLSAVTAPLVIALVTAVLAVPATETLRARVTPYPPLKQAEPHVTDAATTEGEPL